MLTIIASLCNHLVEVHVLDLIVRTCHDQYVCLVIAVEIVYRRCIYGGRVFTYAGDRLFPQLRAILALLCDYRACTSYRLRIVFVDHNQHISLVIAGEVRYRICIQIYILPNNRLPP